MLKRDIKQMLLLDDCSGWVIKRKVNSIKDLTLTEKAVFQKIIFFQDKHDKKSRITNLRIALFYGLTSQYIYKIIKSLLEKDYLKINYKDGNREMEINTTIMPQLEIYQYAESLWVDKMIALVKDLSIKEKFILGEIHNKSKEKYFFGSNNYLAKKFGIGEVQISRIITTIKKKDYFTVSIRKKINNRTAKMYTERRIVLSGGNKRQMERNAVENLGEVDDSILR